MILFPNVGLKIGVLIKQQQQRGVRSAQISGSHDACVCSGKVRKNRLRSPKMKGAAFFAAWYSCPVGSLGKKITYKWFELRVTWSIYLMSMNMSNLHVQRAYVSEIWHNMRWHVKHFFLFFFSSFLFLVSALWFSSSSRCRQYLCFFFRFSPVAVEAFAISNPLLLHHHNCYCDLRAIATQLERCYAMIRITAAAGYIARATTKEWQ